MHNNTIIDELISIRDRAMSLPSLRPGEGYDPLGFRLCEIVSGLNLGLSEAEALFLEMNARDKNLLYDLQDISVRSEMEMERQQAEKIIRRLENRAEREQILSLPPQERWAALLRDYPYAWAVSRATETIRLLRTHDQAFILSSMIYAGRSMLPISALGMHFLTGASITWFDAHDDSRHVAADFIHGLEELGILPSQSFRLSAYYPLEESTQVVVILDDALMQPEIYARGAHSRSLLVMSEPMGLARLLYPTSSRQRPSPENYREHGLLLARHLGESEKQGVPQVLVDTSGDLFVSLSLYVPA